MGVAAAIAAMFAVALAPSGATAAACALSIPTCGCTINSPGTYTLTGSSPMNSTGTCVDITASNVKLIDNGSTTIKGPGFATSTFGVHIEPAANNVFLLDLIVEAFGQGIRVDGPNARVVGGTPSALPPARRRGPAAFSESEKPQPPSQ